MNFRLPAALAAGILFGAGLVISGMTDPTVVMGFLDVAGTFDPTLAFVLGGAVATTFVAFRWVLRQPKPRLDDAFHLPRTRTLDSRLLAGSAIFGIGWGLAGYCPGPALANLASGVPAALVFTIAMLTGALIQRLQSARRSSGNAGEAA